MNKTQGDDIPKKIVEVEEDDEEIIESENENDEVGDDDVNENVDNNVSDIEDPDDDEDDEGDEGDEDDEGDEGDEGDEDDEDDEDDEGDEDEEGDDEEGIAMKKTKKTKKSSNKKNINISGIEMLQTTKKNFPRMVNDDEDDDEDDDDDLNEEYLQKFDNELRENYILDNHPELNSHNYEEIKALSRVTRDGRGIIIDSLHKTIPILTKYEMTRILGQRAKQLDSGAKSFVKVPVNVIDGYFIAMLELEQKKIPFIIKRPLPNGGVEYWNISDLEIIL